MRRAWPHWMFLLLVIGLLVGAPVAAARPPTTVLAGVVADPISGAGLGGVTVRLGSASTVTAADGSFRIESDARGRKPYPTVFEAPGHLPYSSWTPVGADLRRQIFLFPTGELILPGYEVPISAELFRDHFDVVYRNRLPTLVDDGGEKLARWMTQPELVVVNRVMEVVRDGDRKLWRASEELVGPRLRRGLAAAIAAHSGPLTGGFISGERLRVRRLRVGEEVEVEATYAETAPRGQITFWAFPQRKNTHGASVVEGDEIVAGAVTFWKGYLRGDHDTILHEYGHTLGMHHFQHSLGSPSVPLCSLMGNSECRPEEPVTGIDEITARLAYSRLSGNDRQDRDPRAAAQGSAADHPAP